MTTISLPWKPYTNTTYVDWVDWVLPRGGRFKNIGGIEDGWLRETVKCFLHNSLEYVQIVKHGVGEIN